MNSVRRHRGKEAGRGERDVRGCVQVCDVWDKGDVCKALRATVDASGETLGSVTRYTEPHPVSTPADGTAARQDAPAERGAAHGAAAPTEATTDAAAAQQDAAQQDAHTLTPADSTAAAAVGADAAGPAAAGRATAVSETAVQGGGEEAAPAQGSGEGGSGRGSGAAAVQGVAMEEGGAAEAVPGLLARGKGSSGWFPRKAWLDAQERLEVAIHALLPGESEQTAPRLGALPGGPLAGTQPC